MANLSIFVPVLLLALFIKESEPVRCWACTSDLNADCGDPFVVGKSDYQYIFRLVNCDVTDSAATNYPYLTSSKSVCKKQKKWVGNQLVITRGCAWVRQNDYSYQCPSSSDSDGPNAVTDFCQTCDYDGCNGAAAVGTTIALLAAPLTLLLFK